jgi:isoleucyl-tRNA synthetase
LPITKIVFTIIGGEFVDTKSGTGIVHLAPTFGKDDYTVCTKAGIDPFDPLGLDGRFSDEVHVVKGMDVFEANKAIIEKLKWRLKTLDFIPGI